MDKIKNRLNDISIRKSFIIFMLSFMIIAMILSGTSIIIIDFLSEGIKASYQVDFEEKYFLTTEDGKQFGDGTGIIQNYTEPEYSSKDRKLLNILDFMRIAVIPSAYIFCTSLAAALFYRVKLSRAITVLDDASRRIASDDLNFSISYNSRDEMGKLCSSFEKMRSTLEENNLSMWRTSEERRRLNAAFAHDLRTPLTVLKGYNDFVSNNILNEKLSKEKLLTTLNTMGRQIKRLENYVENSSMMQKLDEFEPEFKPVDTVYIIDRLRGIAGIIKAEKEVSLDVIQSDLEMQPVIDFDLILQVFENLMSNALRYSNSKVEIVLNICKDKIILEILDDGKGFSNKGIKKAVEAFYREDKNEDKENHFGLGLYICRLICEKHRGKLEICNSINKGALVTAEFGYKAEL